MLTPSERKKEVALGLTFEHHLHARPSLATVEMHKQNENIHAQRTKRTQLQHETSTAPLLTVVESFLYTEEMPELVLAGNKLSAQALQEIKMLQQDNIKHQCLRGVEAKIQR